MLYILNFLLFSEKHLIDEGIFLNLKKSVNLTYFLTVTLVMR
jgi:hypothetical protein